MGSENAMIIGLTGGIATGKSTVSALLASRGAYLIDSDQIARQVVERGEPAYEEIVKHFGKQVLLPDGQIDRKELGRIVFANPEERAILEKITHPHIFREIKKRIEVAKAEGKKLIFLDVPLLFETGLDRQVDLTLLIDTDERIQLERLIKRDQLSREEAERRIEAQMPMGEKRKKADYILSNRGSIKELEEEVERFLKWVEEKRG
ncbi:Dephospho-CoA kinase [[Clostridium] ultunense Esp]|uniref:dephospho-CoA kinase n=1 Tax=Thermicanus aegyptius TaxID=94009 RepID=UPI0002B7048B|nr:dephospho-CoA kinase [Thermicanus aegyptius]CCQ93605.1 Dephospho-CoA kinase [[Clostridium] ultunense Esp]